MGIFNNLFSQSNYKLIQNKRYVEFVEFPMKWKFQFQHRYINSPGLLHKETHSLTFKLLFFQTLGENLQGYQYESPCVGSVLIYNKSGMTALIETGSPKINTGVLVMKLLLSKKHLGTYLT